MTHFANAREVKLSRMFRLLVGLAFWVLSFVLLSISFSHNVLAQEEGQASDRAVLMALYELTDGPNWHLNKNWGSDAVLGAWYGVVTDENDRVTELHLGANTLSGKIPPRLGRLSELEILDLHQNELQGKIPPELGKLKNVLDLNLEGNELTGRIPPELATLPILRRLDLSYNQLSGVITHKLGDLSELGELKLRANEFAGIIPTELSLLSNLKTLDLGYNQLRGGIPPQLGNLTKLDELVLRTNKLGGELPTELGLLANLRILDLTDNEFSGEIPQEFGTLTKLEELDLHGNLLTGNVPLEVYKLNYLRVIDLAYNQLTGKIPREVGNLSNLVSLNLNINIFSGKIPAEIGSLSNLVSLRLNDNQFIGEIPVEFGSLSNLTVLQLGGNGLRGGIPPELGNLSHLRLLSTCSNPLQGKIPPELGNLLLLEDLILCNNQLTGEIPEEFGNLRNLKRLRLYNNQMTGKIPSELEHMVELEAMDVQSNYLSGKIPPELGNLPRMRSLYLRDNNLSGPIPSELGNLSSLIWLSFEDNRLTGRIPSDLGRLRSLQGLQLGQNLLMGDIPLELGNLSDLEKLYLQDNRLSGKIPPELGNLSKLEEVSLEANELQGNIPPEFGALSNLRRLNLSYNELTGRIPPSLGKLHKLEDLALRNNDLSECVPWLLEINPFLEDDYYDDDLAGCPNPSVDEGESIRFYIPHLVFDTGLEGDTLSHNSVSNSVNGQVTLRDETIIYEHDGSETTTGSFSYTLSNGFLRLSADVVVDVIPGNDPPVGGPDIIAVDEGGIVSLVASELLVNDTDTEDDALMVTAVGDAFNGTVRLVGSTITYAHDDSNTLEGGFTYTVSDGTSSSKGEVVVEVSPVNDPPLAATDTVTVDEGGVVILNVSELLENDVDLDGDAINLTAVGNAVNGEVILEGAIITYEHDGSESTEGSFTYTVSDGVAVSTAEVIVDVSPVNDPPVAISDRVAVDEGGKVIINASELLANDTDVDSEILRVTSVGDEVNGRALLEGTTVVYEHDGSETTVGSFSYTLSDGVESNRGEVVVVVTPVNDPPVATADRFVVDQGGTLSIFASELANNDVDADGDSLRVAAVSNELNGSVRLEGTAIVYEHDGSNTIRGGFTYVITDGIASDSAEVVVDVTPVNKSPKAVADEVSVDEGGAILVDVSVLLENDTDVDGDTLMVLAVGNGVNGKVLLEGANIVYEHNGSESTEGGFTYTLSDGIASDAGLVVVSVKAVNDPPVANIDSMTVREGGKGLLDISELLANDTDVDKDTLRVVAVGNAENGRVLLEGTTVIYEHDGSETTGGSFTYTVSDGSVDVTSEVVVGVTPVNDPPVAGIDMAKVNEGDTVLIFVSELLENDADADSETLRVTAVGSPLHGRVLLDGTTIIYEHDGTETTRGGFNYTLTDEVESATGEVRVDVSPVNDPPFAVPDRVEMNEGDSLTLDVWELLKNDTDPENDALSVTAVGSALNGRVLLDETTVTYEHDGSETIGGGFEYTVTDGSARNTGQVQIDVKPVSDFPTTLAIGLSIGACLATIVAVILFRKRRSTGAE